MEDAVYIHLLFYCSDEVVLRYYSSMIDCRDYGLFPINDVYIESNC